jgi:hypothetical protein
MNRYLLLERQAMVDQPTGQEEDGATRLPPAKTTEADAARFDDGPQVRLLVLAWTACPVVET